MQSSDAGGSSMQPERKPATPSQPATAQKRLLDGITSLSGTVSFSAAGTASFQVEITPMGATMDSGPTAAGQASATVPADSRFSSANRTIQRDAQNRVTSDTISASGPDANGNGLANAVAGGYYTVAIRYSSGGTVTRKATISNVVLGQQYTSVSFT